MKTTTHIISFSLAILEPRLYPHMAERTIDKEETNVGWTLALFLTAYVILSKLLSLFEPCL